MRSRAANARPDFLQLRQGITRGIDVMKNEALLECGDDRRPLRAEKSDFDTRFSHYALRAP
jgi:hypothetical protein